MEDPIAVLQHSEMEDMKKEIAQLKEEIKCMRALIMTNYDSAIKCTHSTADALFKKMLDYAEEGIEDYKRLRAHLKGIDAVRKEQVNDLANHVKNMTVITDESIDSLQRQISELQTKP